MGESYMKRDNEIGWDAGIGMRVTTGGANEQIGVIQSVAGDSEIFYACRGLI